MAELKLPTFDGSLNESNTIMLRQYSIWSIGALEWAPTNLVPVDQCLVVHHNQGAAPAKEPARQCRQHRHGGGNAPWPGAWFSVWCRFPAEKAALCFDGSSRSCGQRTQTDESGQQAKDDLNEKDHAAIIAGRSIAGRRKRRAAGSVRPASNTCGGRASMSRTASQG
jgi:hypothetical protein